MDNEFERVWATPADYPNTLLRPIQSHEYHERNYRRERLHREEKELFHESEHYIEFFETGRENNFVEHGFESVNEMKSHLNKKGDEPQIRHTFLESDGSRSPISCDLVLLKTLFTYHQVEHSFLDAVQAFGECDEAKDFCLISFRSHDTLTLKKDKLAAIPKLNRSGREINLSYLLRAPEAKRDKDWKWQIRQAAVYHSFDTETGKSFWCTIKGNDGFSKRIKQSSRYLGLSSGGAGSDNSMIPKNSIADYFSAALATHMVYFAWCDENWRDFVNDVEDAIRRPLELARSAPIDDDMEAGTTSKLRPYPRSQRGTKTRNSTMGTPARGSRVNSKRGTGLSAGGGPGALRKRSTLDVIEGAGNALMSYLKMGGIAKTKLSDPEKDGAGVPTATGPFVASGAIEDHMSRSSEEGPIDAREVLSEFRFKDVQTLYTFSDRIRRAILTLTLNISVLQEVYEYFSERLLKGDLERFRHIKEGSRDNGGTLVEFLREVRSLSKRLETRRTQLECLGTLLSEGNALYDGVLQYRQLDISQRFQETGQRSAKHMQTMADKTRVETASMHVITVVTMIFLPATFVAMLWLIRRYLMLRVKTFFQSGIFLWNNDSPSQVDIMEQTGESYKYRADGLTLFVAVSVPMMVVTVGIWLYVFLNMRRNMRASFNECRDGTSATCGLEGKK